MGYNSLSNRNQNKYFLIMRERASFYSKEVDVLQTKSARQWKIKYIRSAHNELSFVHHIINGNISSRKKEEKIDKKVSRNTASILRKSKTAGQSLEEKQGGEEEN